MEQNVSTLFMLIIKNYLGINKENPYFRLANFRVSLLGSIQDLFNFVQSERNERQELERNTKEGKKRLFMGNQVHYLRVQT